MGMVLQRAASEAMAAPAGGPLGDVAHSDTVRRQLIRNADVSIEVKSVDTAIVHLGRIAGSLGGYVSSQEQSVDEPGGRRRGVVVLRIPASRIDAALAEVTALGKVESERVWTEDVTEQYYDLTTRLRVAQEERAQLEQILRTARRVEDVLAVQRELSRVTAEIEQMTGALRRLTNLISYSTITVQLHEPLPLTENRRTVIGKLSGAFRDMVGMFWTTIAVIIRLVGIVVPVGIVLGALAWVAARVGRAWRRRRRGAAEKAAGTP